MIKVEETADIHDAGVKLSHQMWLDCQATTRPCDTMVTMDHAELSVVMETLFAGFKFQECPKTFKRKRGLSQHVAFAHADENSKCQAAPNTVAETEEDESPGQRLKHKNNE